MPIPDFQTIMRPLLVVLSDGQEHTATEMREHLAAQFALTAEELEAQIPSGRARCSPIGLGGQSRTCTTRL